MTEFVVDTNVAVVANRQNLQVCTDCADACVEFLIEAQAKHVVLVDDQDEIRAEYAKALAMGRPYQLGAQFLIHLLRNQFNEDRVRRVVLKKDAGGNCEDFPTDPALAGFDQSDRKFATLARTENVAIVNAIDRDWVDHLQALVANDINVIFLCGDDPSRWFVRN